MLLRIKELRKQAGLSQIELAAKANVSQGKISEYETGKSVPRLDTASKIADALHIGRNDFEDLVTGYTCTMKDVVLAPSLLAIIDGGTMTDTGGANGLFAYVGPQIGLVLTRKRVTIDIWTEEKDADGESLSYARFRVQHAKGKPVSFSFSDGAFYAPEYKLESVPKIGEQPLQIMQFLSLPDTDLTAAELLALTNVPEPPPEG